MLGLVTAVTIVDPRHLLPPREGSLILVLGGAAVLVISLGLALVTDGSRLQRRSPPTPKVGPRPKHPASRATPAGETPRSRLSLQEAFLKASARASVGTPQIVTDNPGPHALVLLRCLTCRRSAPSSGCEWKRRTLEQALCQFTPGVHVHRVSCHPEEQRACIFEIRAGDVGS